MPVMTVALDRVATSFANRVFKRGDSLLLGRRRAGHGENFFFENRSVEIVNTVAQRDLRERQSEADPIRRQMIDVVEVNTAHREIAQLLECGAALDIAKYSLGLRGLECKVNKPSEPSDFILQLPQLAQMINPMRKR